MFKPKLRIFAKVTTLLTRTRTASPASPGIRSDKAERMIAGAPYPACLAREQPYRLFSCFLCLKMV